MTSDGNVRHFVPFFADWRARPGRTAEWRDSKRSNFPTDDQWRREYPETVDDVMLGSEESVFPTWAIQQAQVGAIGPTPPILAAEGRAAHRYLKTWDIGRMHDAAVGIVIDWTTAPYQVVHYYRSVQLPFPVLQNDIDAVNRLYPGAAYVEDNGPGLAVIENLKTAASAFNTNTRTKVDAIMSLKLALESGWLKFPSADRPGCALYAQMISELQGYMWADESLVQDTVMTLAIAAAKLPVPQGFEARPAIATGEGRMASTRPTAAARQSRMAGMPSSARAGRRGDAEREEYGR